MRSILIPIVLVFSAGCAHQSRVAVQSPLAPLVAAASPTKLVETRYDVRGYRDVANPSIRHEAHAVYRRTRVPDNQSEPLEGAPRTSFAPASVAPLPVSAELAAELATQKAITADLRAMQASVAETQRRMEAEYGQLVQESNEAVKLREQLEATRRKPDLADVGPPLANAENTRAEVRW